MTDLDRLVRRAFGTEPQGTEPLAGDLGARRFVRVALAGRPSTCIARIEAPNKPSADPLQPEPDLEPLRTWLEAAGLPVPLRYDGEAGIELLEDLGDTCLRRAAASASPEERRRLYEEACTLPTRLQALKASASEIPAFGRRLDARAIRFKRDVFLAGSLPDASAGEVAAVGAAFEAVEEAVSEAPLRLAHRDFMADNLLLAGGRLVMIDLQGALLAPPEYDLVCLLRDARSPLPGDEWQTLAETTRRRLPDAPDAETFAHRFDLLTVSRNAKDHARFLTVTREQGRRHGIEYAPAALTHAREAAARLGGADARFAALAEILQRVPEVACEP